jgi:hypothetical protein
MTIIIGRYRIGEGLVPEGCTRIGCRSSRVKIINTETTTWYVLERDNYGYFSRATQYGMPKYISKGSQSIAPPDETTQL